MSGTVRSVTLTTSDGCTLDADLTLPSGDGAVRGAAVLTHPHPLYGGDRHNMVVDALFRALPEAGFAALRLDFRGVGRSTGTHDDGRGECLDVVAALDGLDGADGVATDVPRFLVGYSFGSAVALRVLDHRVRGWVAVAPPLSMLDVPDRTAFDRPTLLLVPEHDQFSPPEKARAVAAGWAGTDLEVVPQADHFLGGRTRWVAEHAVAWLTARVG